MASVEILRSLNLDAYSNLFDIEIPSVPGLESFEEIKYRIQNFSIPETVKPNMYQTHYKTQSIERMGGKFEKVFETTFTMRIDKFHFAYDFMKNWVLLGVNSSTGVIDESLIPKVPVIIRSTDSGDEGTGLLVTFVNAYPIVVGGTEMSQENGDAMTRDITLHFDDFDITQRG